MTREEFKALNLTDKDVILITYCYGKETITNIFAFKNISQTGVCCYDDFIDFESIKFASVLPIQKIVNFIRPQFDLFGKHFVKSIQMFIKTNIS